MGILKENWIGCHMGNSYFGGMGYADYQITLSVMEWYAKKCLIFVLTMLMSIILNVMAVRAACFYLKVDNISIHRECWLLMG